MKKKGLLIFVIIGALLVGGMAYYLSGNPGKDKVETSDTTEETVPTNPLTGATVEEGFDADALNRRVVAIVVENTLDARPQWGMDDQQYSPDIILQGEVEGGITRTLWFFADYNKIPEKVGPMRSARPPYIKFSELFDSIFIHWGASHSKGEYIGANKVFQWDGIDHIDQMTFNDTVGLYDRDHTRAVSMEHTGILYGDKVAAAIEAEGFRTEPEMQTKLQFDKLAWMLRIPDAETVKVTFSDKTSWESTVWTYDPEDEQYHTAHFHNDLSRDNLLILMDKTEYITKSDYQGAGGSVTYCDYERKGGDGYLISKGVCKKIKWHRKKKTRKLTLTDVEATEKANARAKAEAEENGTDPEEVKPVKIKADLYPGKTWIGWVSSNNGGKVEISSETLGKEVIIE
jgi:hypothetical protein